MYKCRIDIIEQNTSKVDKIYVFSDFLFDIDKQKQAPISIFRSIDM